MSVSYTHLDVYKRQASEEGWLSAYFGFLIRMKWAYLIFIDKVTENNIILNDYPITKISINSEISLRVGDVFLEITEPNSSKLF